METVILVIERREEVVPRKIQMIVSIQATVVCRVSPVTLKMKSYQKGVMEIKESEMSVGITVIPVQMIKDPTNGQNLPLNGKTSLMEKQERTNENKFNGHMAD